MCGEMYTDIFVLVRYKEAPSPPHCITDIHLHVAVIVFELAVPRPSLTRWAAA